MKQAFTYLLFIISITFIGKGFAQNSTFITLNYGGTFTRVTVGASGCNSTPLNLCSNFSGSALSIALDSNILYFVTNKGLLYKNILTSTGTVGSCTLLGQFAHNTTGYFGLTVGPTGIVYAAYGSDIETYNPNTGSFGVLGTLPNGWIIGGDLLFYQGKLYEAVNTTTGANSLIEINLSNVAASTLYMNFNAGSNVFGFASVSLPCANNQSYAISTNGSNTDIYAVDMTAKTQAATSTCTLPFKVNDAASIAESGAYTPPLPPTVTTPIAYCQNATATALTATATGTLQWYNNFVGGTATTTAPIPNTSSIGSTTYYLSQKDALGCESDRDSIVVNINKSSSSSTTINAIASYTWNGTTYTTSGTYIKTGLMNSKGCDSTATLILTIKAAATNPCWKMITTGFNHTIAIKADGTLWAWGQNTYGQVGDGTNAPKNIPTQIGTDTNWATISAKGFHSVAIKSNGTLWAWGQNSFGQVGDGTNINRSLPVQVGTATNWTSISSGISFTLALKNDGTLWAWGYNILGQLGDGTLTNRSTPIQIGTDNNWATIGTGEFHSAAIKADGTLWTWGSNSNGQLGDGTTVSKKVPTQIGTDNNWASFKGGNAHTIALKTDNTLWTWGGNLNGQLGDGTNTSKNTPTQLGVANNWRAINAGGGFSVALTTAGTIWACGKNTNGQLGNGTTVNNNTLTQIGSDVDWVTINAGDNHLVASKTDGSIWAWGYNLFGQLGDGTNADKSTPKVVVNACCPTAKIDTLNLFDCDSVFYKGVWYSYPTTIYDTLKSVGGCDSVNLVVNVETFINRIPYAYIANNGSGNISVINLINYQVVKTIPLSSSVASPREISTAPDGSRVYVSNWGSLKLSIIDTKNNSIINTLDPSGLPRGTCVSKKESKIYVTINGLFKGLKVYNTNNFALINSVNLGVNPNCVLLSPDETKVYVCDIYKNEVYVLDNSNLSLITTISVGTRPNFMSLNKTGSLLYVINQQSNDVSVINTFTNTVINTISVGTSPSASTFDSSGRYLFVTNGVSNTISVINTSTNSLMTNIVLSGAPQGIDLYSNKNELVVNILNKNSVSIINANTFSLLNNIKVISNPISFGSFVTYVPFKGKLKDTLNFSSCSSITYKSKIYTSSTSFTDTTKSYRGCDSVYTLVNINITNNVIKDTLKQLRACNQLVYKGNAYTVSIIILDSIVKTVNGSCDSMYHYAQIIITPITATTNTTNFSNCKSITYLGNNYTTSTIVRDTAKSYQGCDSIYNIANIVITPVTPVTNTNNFNHCKQIVYNGNTYTSSTVVRDTVRSVNGGCDSIYNIVNININPITPTNTNLSFSDCKQVIYKGKTYTTSTVVKDTTKSYQGCDSIYNVATITIKSITPKINTVNFSHCKRIVYNTITYTSSTILKDTVKSVQGCDSIYNIVNITITPIIAINNFTVLSNCDSVVFRGITYYNSASVSDTLKSYQGCDSIYYIHNIIIQPKPTITVTKDIYVLPNTPITLTPNYTQDDSYSWSPTTYLDDPTAKYPTCIPATDITYKIKVFNAIGCSDTASLKVFVAKMPVIPNVFSPNGDNINDTWDITNINTYPRNTVQVFDRYGRKLYSSFPGAYKAWNGKFNGKDVSIGVYYYIIYLDSTKSVLTGSITVLK